MRASISLAIALLACFLLGACGGGSGGSRPRPHGFTLTSVTASAGLPLALDGTLVFRFSEAVDESTLGADAIEIQTPDGKQARGTFVRGRLLLDPDSGTVAVIDPDPLGEQQIALVERTGDLGLIPPEIRYDLGARSDLLGSRRVLIDRSRRDVVTFVPEVPGRADFSDLAFVPGADYLIRLPVAPSP